jgi:hypothetical protein
MKTPQVEVTEQSFDEGETIVLEGRTMNDGTGIHKVLMVIDDPETQDLLAGDQLCLLEDGPGASGLGQRNHSGYNPYDRPISAKRPAPKKLARA